MASTGQSYLKEVLPPQTKESAKWNALLHPRLTHGGPPSRGRRKVKRPFFSNVPQLFVLSSARARGKWSFEHRKNRSRITSQIYTYAKRFRIKVYLARVKSGQIELLIKAADRKDLADFFRVLAGRVAVTLTGAKRGMRRIGRFWNELCWSKLLNWGREFHEISHFVSGLGPIRIPGSSTVAAESTDDSSLALGNRFTGSAGEFG